MDVSIWNVLHDGSIESASGQIPGTVSLGIDIQYLRERFSDAGRLFILTLENCTRFEFQPYDENTLTSLDEIAKRDVQILSADDTGGKIEISCAIHRGAGGVLRVVAAHYALALDSGRKISYQEIERVADEYWNEFSGRNRTS